MTVAAVVFALGAVFLGSGIMYAGGGLRKLAALSGSYGAQKNRVYDQGIRRLEKRLRESANAGDAYAGSILDDLAKIRDEISNTEDQFKENADRLSKNPK